MWSIPLISSIGSHGALAALTDPLPGVRLENHELALTLHVRDASEADADLAEDALYRVAESQIAEKIVRCYRGAEAFELAPCVGSDEGDACASLVDALAERHERPVWPVCVAGDVRGDSMFDAVASTGLSVADDTRPSRARLRLCSLGDVDGVWRRLIAEPSAGRST